VLTVALAVVTLVGTDSAKIQDASFK